MPSITLLLPCLAPAAAGLVDEPRTPFVAILWDGDAPFARLARDDDQWHELIAIDDVPVSRILAHSRRVHGSRWRKRFAEDLIDLLLEMGHKPGATMKLTSRARGSDGIVTRTDVPATGENRRAVIDSRDRLDPIGATCDLAILRRALESSYAYLHRTGHDPRPALARIEAQAASGAPLSVDRFAVDVAKALAPLGDGHTGVVDLAQRLPRGYLPALIENQGDRLVAIAADRSSLVSDQHPYLTHIDGIPVELWLRAAGGVAPHGSEAFVTRQCTRLLRYVAFLRGELGRTESDRVALTLAAVDGARTSTVRLPLADDRPIHGSWPGTQSRLMENNVGYLRIAEMDDDASFLAGLRRWMERFRDTRGLVIDVRGNGGGSRAALLMLLPYFLSGAAPARVVNVAAYRIPPEAAKPGPEGFLNDRFLYPRGWNGWSADAHRAIEALAAGFRPEWDFRGGASNAGAVGARDQFSELHYCVVTADASTPFRYRQPVIVLMNADCFSATDIFLGAFKGLSGVTLMGTPSSGGSGRAQPVELPNSRVTVRLSSMASFQPDGRLYDGRGIEPDVVAHPVPTDFTGATDTVLDAAVARLVSP